MKQTSVFARDPELLAAVRDRSRRNAALERGFADELITTGGPLDVDALAEGGCVGLLVLSGFMCREIAVDGRVVAALAGPQDLLLVQPLPPFDELAPTTTSFVALGPTRLALLDEAFLARVGAWPSVLVALIERARRSGDRSLYVRALARSSAVEVRLLQALWYWASWWSSVVADGVLLPVPLSHERIARLIGAARPTVTTAIGGLRRKGYLAQRSDGQWLLQDPHRAGAAHNGEDSLLGLGALRLPPRLAQRANVRARSSFHEASSRPDLYAAMAEQRELLRVAAERHREQLKRLRSEWDRLRMTTELSTLARQARTRNGARGGEPRTDGVSERIA